jgi:hypothetical protein
MELLEQVASNESQRAVDDAQNTFLQRQTLFNDQHLAFHGFTGWDHVSPWNIHHLGRQANDDNLPTHDDY